MNMFFRNVENKVEVNYENTYIVSQYQNIAPKLSKVDYVSHDR